MQKGQWETLRGKSGYGEAEHWTQTPGNSQTRRKKIDFSPRRPLNETWPLDPTVAQGHEQLEVCLPGSHHSLLDICHYSLSCAGSCWPLMLPVIFTTSTMELAPTPQRDPEEVWWVPGQVI